MRLHLPSPLLQVIRGETSPHLAGLRSALSSHYPNISLLPQDILYKRVAPLHASSSRSSSGNRSTTRLYASDGSSTGTAGQSSGTAKRKGGPKVSSNEFFCSGTGNTRASVEGEPSSNNNPTSRRARSRSLSVPDNYDDSSSTSEASSSASATGTASRGLKHTSSYSSFEGPEGEIRSSSPASSRRAAPKLGRSLSQSNASTSTSNPYTDINFIPSPSKSTGSTSSASKKSRSANNDTDSASASSSFYHNSKGNSTHLPPSNNGLKSNNRASPTPQPDSKSQTYPEVPDALVQGIQQMHEQTRPVRPNVQFAPLSPEMLAFFEKRCITQATLDKFGIKMAPRVYCNQQKKNVDAIAFPYLRNGELINVKYRALPKSFWQEKNAEKILYGYDQVVAAHGPVPEVLIIVEGEMDVLALHEAGYTNVVSVPDGAPAMAKPMLANASPLSTVKFSYLGNSWSLLQGVQKFIIATDNDNPGNALAEELMRRLNRELCWRVKWSKIGPPKVKDTAALVAGTAAAEVNVERQAGNDELQPGLEMEPGHHLQEEGVEAACYPGGVQGEGATVSVAEAEGDTEDYSKYRKDGNEVLVKDGPEEVRQRVIEAEPSPVVGLYRFKNYLNDILSQYRHDDDQSVTYSTGWPSALDNIYKVVLGEVTIVSGVPNSGKSEWIDALLMKLSEQYGWAFALCSLEKTPDKHAIQLIEKYIDKPFYDRWDYDNVIEDENGDRLMGKIERMSEDEVLNGLYWINDRFQIISNTSNDFPTIDWILDKARLAVLRHGIYGLVIDPYNEINHARSKDMNETEYVSVMMSKVKKFAQAYDVAVWFVAHPRQQQAWSGGAPDMYCISGSANFVNKADNVIMVHRPYQPKGGLDQDSAKGSKQQELLPNEVRIYMCKVRNKLAGTRSEIPARLCYDRASGRYYEDPADLPRRNYNMFRRSNGEIIGEEGKILRGGVENIWVMQATAGLNSIEEPVVDDDESDCEDFRNPPESSSGYAGYQESLAEEEEKRAATRM